MSTGKRPEISVVMSVYNGEKYLSETLESVCFQTFDDWELIAVDDCSADATPEILKEYALRDGRIKVIRNERNMKLAASLNRAVENACGRYIARIDADDICLPNRLERQFAFMESRSDVDLSSCRFFTQKDGKISSGGGGGPCDADSVKAMLLFANPILHPGVIAKSSVMKSFRYNEALTCTEDLDLWTRMAANGKRLEIQDEYLVIYRLHPSQITATTAERQRTEVLGIQERYFSSLGMSMSDSERSYYIDGMYFKDAEKIDIGEFSHFARHLKKLLDGCGISDKYALDRALIEVLAEYKRKGISPVKIVLGAVRAGISPLFFVGELSRRKRRARADGLRCIAAAEKIGLHRTGKSDTFPTFSE